MDCDKQVYSRQDDMDDYICQRDRLPCLYLGTEWLCPYHQKGGLDGGEEDVGA